jgi:hypothetical protein
MAVTIGDDSMSSDNTMHTARLTPGTQHEWEVSWLPGRHLDRNSAITAMVLADTTGPGGIDAGHRLWPHIQGWAGELGLTAPDVLALTRTTTNRNATATAKTAEPADPEAAG